MGVDYPIAIDNDFAVWRAFANAPGPRSTSPTRRDGSGITTSARRTTSAPSGSSSSCSPRRDATSSTATWSRSSRPASSSRPTGHARLAGDLRRLRPDHRLRVTGGLEPDRSRRLRRAGAARAQPVGARPATGRSASRPRRWTSPAAGSPSASAGATSTSSWAPGRTARPCASSSGSTGSRRTSAHGLDVDEQGNGDRRRRPALPADPPATARSPTAPSRSPSSTRAPRPTSSPSAERARGRPETTKPPQVAGVSCEAAEETRTLDLLHGKQTL